MMEAVGGREHGVGGVSLFPLTGMPQPRRGDPAAMRARIPRPSPWSPAASTRAPPLYGTCSHAGGILQPAAGLRAFGGGVGWWRCGRGTVDTSHGTGNHVYSWRWWGGGGGGGWRGGEVPRRVARVRNAMATMRAGQEVSSSQVSTMAAARVAMIRRKPMSSRRSRRFRSLRESERAGLLTVRSSEASQAGRAAPGNVVTRKRADRAGEAPQ
jgi:hypothetical protein